MTLPGGAVTLVAPFAVPLFCLICFASFCLVSAATSNRKVATPGLGLTYVSPEIWSGRAAVGENPRRDPNDAHRPRHARCADPLLGGFLLGRHPIFRGIFRDATATARGALAAREARAAKTPGVAAGKTHRIAPYARKLEHRRVGVWGPWRRNCTFSRTSKLSFQNEKKELAAKQQVRSKCTTLRARALSCRAPTDASEASNTSVLNSREDAIAARVRKWILRDTVLETRWERNDARLERKRGFV